jgi:16S rRNA processing protein RimM
VSAPERALAGRLLGPFGVRGEIKCRPAGFGAAAFSAGAVYALGREQGERELRCTNVRKHRDDLLLTFEGIGSPEAARALCNTDLYAAMDALPLASGEYFDRDLIGLRLVDVAGNSLGEVVGVEHLPAQDCLVVGPGRALVPLVRAFVKRVDLVARTIDVDLPEGLL